MCEFEKLHFRHGVRVDFFKAVPLQCFVARAVHVVVSVRVRNDLHNCFWLQHAALAFTNCCGSGSIEDPNSLIKAVFLDFSPSVLVVVVILFAIRLLIS